MCIVLLRPVAISTGKTTDRPTGYVENSQEFHVLVQYMCNQKVDVLKSWLLLT